MNSSFPIAKGVCGGSASGTAAVAAGCANPRASRSWQQLAALLLVAACWTGTAGRALGQASSAAAAQTGVQSGVQTGTQNPGSVAGETQAQPATPLGNQAMLYPGEDFTLSAGDLISVSVFMQPEYTATVRLKLDGTAILPLIGSVPLQGLSVQAAQALIADRLRTAGIYNEPEVTIRVLDTVNGSVLITGEVRAVIPVANARTLRDVLLSAGGLPANANHTVKIVRPGEAEPIVVDLGPDLAASSAGNIPVHPHDIIQISRASVVYVLGAFSHQGSVPLDQATPLTLLQLAALSGGINYEGQYNDLRLIRTVGTERKMISVDIKKIRSGKADDPILQANDIIFLPTNNMKAALKSLGIGGVIGLVSLLYAIRDY